MLVSIPNWCTCHYKKHKMSLDSFIYNVTLHMVPQMLQPVPSSKTVYMLQDYSTYLLHRLYHTPWLYKKFHKAHHKYVQPTAFSVTAIHPFEIVHTQLMAYCMPLFVFPTHWSKWLKRIRKSYVYYLFMEKIQAIVR